MARMLTVGNRGSWYFEGHAVVAHSLGTVFA
jgi:hypothetical protein